MRIGAIGSNNYIKMFSEFLKAFGDHLPTVSTKTEKKLHGGYEGPNRRELDMENYVSQHGTIRRRHPKRDKTMSARQWKKLVKARRREAKENAERQSQLV